MILRSLPILALLSAPLLAHDPGTLSGRVKDAGGRPLAGVLVEVSGPALPAPLRTRTDAAGAYALRGLPKGSFQVAVRHPGYDAVQRGVSTEAGHAVALDLVLHAGGATVEVTDTAGLAHLSDLDAPVNHLLGIADSAGQGVVTPAKLSERAYLRAGEVLETVPGLLVSQHSGEGKANQYYLRGFDLDHGTDVATTVAGLPVNLPTHAHGQGYSDLNFLIPELVSHIQYAKGPYFADQGDFTAAGAVQVHYLHALERPFVQVDAGGHGYRRVLAAGSGKAGGGDLLGALELMGNDGPWEHPDAYRKANGLLRWSWSGPADAVELTAMAYRGRWDGTDQVPERALASGRLGRFGAVDLTDGGSSHRRSLVAAWTHAGQGTQSRVEAYVSGYDLDLYSDFTYFLDDPVEGDQFRQVDRRTTSGLRASQRWSGAFLGRAADLELGLQVRRDRIGTVELDHTRARQVLETRSVDAVTESGEALYLQGKVQWTPALRTVIGLREDLYQFDVDGRQARARIGSPKVGLVLGPWRDTELYLSWGLGFHSNDARSVVGVAGATPLVRARGWEAGLRSSVVPAWQTTFSLWRLDLGSELVFAGDAGGTEAGRPSRRTGLEWANELRLGRFGLDADLAWSRARHAGGDPAGDRIPGAVRGVGLLGLHWKASEALELGALDRWFGPRDLAEDGSVRSRASNLVQLQARWRATPHLTLTADLFNALDARVSDIDYFYASRLPGEPAEGVADVHTHPAEPRTLRLGAKWRF